MSEVVAFGRINDALIGPCQSRRSPDKAPIPRRPDSVGVADDDITGRIMKKNLVSPGQDNLPGKSDAHALLEGMVVEGVE